MNSGTVPLCSTACLSQCASSIFMRGQKSVNHLGFYYHHVSHLFYTDYVISLKRPLQKKTCIKISYSSFCSTMSGVWFAQLINNISVLHIFKNKNLQKNVFNSWIKPFERTVWYVLLKQDKIHVHLFTFVKWC